jgi:hypothetical protein
LIIHEINTLLTIFDGGETYGNQAKAVVSDDYPGKINGYLYRFKTQIGGESK